LVFGVDGHPKKFIAFGLSHTTVRNHVVSECVLGGSVHTVKKNAEALVAATKETGLEANAHKTKYMTVFRDQNA
jgi:hypothetical protein